MSKVGYSQLQGPLTTFPSTDGMEPCYQGHGRWIRNSIYPLNIETRHWQNCFIVDQCTFEGFPTPSMQEGTMNMMNYELKMQILQSLQSSSDSHTENTPVTCTKFHKTSNFMSSHPNHWNRNHVLRVQKRHRPLKRSSSSARPKGDCHSCFKQRNTTDRGMHTF